MNSKLFSKGEGGYLFKTQADKIRSDFNINAYYKIINKIINKKILLYIPFLFTYRGHVIEPNLVNGVNWTHSFY